MASGSLLLMRIRIQDTKSIWIRKDYPTTQYKVATSFQCCGSGMFIPNPGFDFFQSRVPDPIFCHPGSRICIKEFKYFNPKKWFLSSQWSGLFIPDPDPGSWFFTHPGSRIQGSKVTRSRIWIRNTGCFTWTWPAAVAEFCSNALIGCCGPSPLLLSGRAPRSRIWSNSENIYKLDKDPGYLNNGCPKSQQSPTNKRVSIKRDLITR